MVKLIIIDKDGEFMGKYGRAKREEKVTNIAIIENTVLEECDFEGIIREADYEAPITTDLNNAEGLTTEGSNVATSLKQPSLEQKQLQAGSGTGRNTEQKFERIVKEFSKAKAEKNENAVTGKNKLANAVVSYLKRNWLFLGIMFFLWMILGVEHSFKAYNFPVVGTILRLFNKQPQGGILRFLTATYNGPVSFGDFMKPTFYGYIVAFVAKPIYLLAMTGVVLPMIKGLFKKDPKTSGSFLKSTSYFKTLLTGMLREVNHMALALTGLGIALIITNLLTRNGKIDKGFVPILLAIVLLAGIKEPAASLLDKIISRALGALLHFIPNGLRGAIYKIGVIKTGCILGFTLGVLTGRFGENINYTIGIICFIAGAVILMFVREKKAYGNE